MAAWSTKNHNKIPGRWSLRPDGAVCLGVAVFVLGLMLCPAVSIAQSFERFSREDVEGSQPLQPSIEQRYFEGVDGPKSQEAKKQKDEKKGKAPQDRDRKGEVSKKAQKEKAQKEKAQKEKAQKEKAQRDRTDKKKDKDKAKDKIRNKKQVQKEKKDPAPAKKEQASKQAQKKKVQEKKVQEKKAQEKKRAPKKAQQSQAQEQRDRLSKADQIDRTPAGQQGRKDTARRAQGRAQAPSPPSLGQAWLKDLGPLLRTPKQRRQSLRPHPVRSRWQGEKEMPAAQSSKEQNPARKLLSAQKQSSNQSSAGEDGFKPRQAQEPRKSSDGSSQNRSEAQAATATDDSGLTRGQGEGGEGQEEANPGENKPSYTSADDISQLNPQGSNLLRQAPELYNEQEGKAQNKAQGIWQSLLKDHRYSLLIERADKVSAQDKHYPEALYWKGIAQARLGQWDEAIKSFTRLNREHGSHDYSDDALVEAALAYERKGRFGAAVDSLFRVVQKHAQGDQVDDALYHLGRIYAHSPAIKNEKRARYFFQQLVRQYQSGERQAQNKKFSPYSRLARQELKRMSHSIY